MPVSGNSFRMLIWPDTFPVLRLEWLHLNLKKVEHSFGQANIYLLRFFSNQLK